MLKVEYMVKDLPELRPSSPMAPDTPILTTIYPFSTISAALLHLPFSQQYQSIVILLSVLLLSEVCQITSGDGVAWGHNNPQNLHSVVEHY